MEEELFDGRYRQLGLLGQGGEARVFRALDRQSGREVALRLPLGAKGEAAKIPALEFHRGWVRPLAAGWDAVRGPYQVLELIVGESLQQKVQRGPLTDAELSAFVRESLEAVQALHAAGWVHGDLNAENFLQAEESAIWKLLELPFLSFAAPGNRPAAFGSIHTLAPEQLQGRAPDARSDLYALGCLYYYGATGEYPNAGATRAEIAVSLLRFVPAPILEKRPGLAPSLAEWMMRLLERDPARRFSSLAEARGLLGEIQVWRD